MELTPELPTTFNQENFHEICDQLAEMDADLKSVLEKYGYPPMWTRPNTFETLVHIILEQQVSLASALAALNKLREKTKTLTPETLLLLNDEEMRACYVSRQKAAYLRGLALSLQNGETDLTLFPSLPDEKVREKLIRLKGIGHWTIDVYFMFVLQRIDIFPLGDLAAINGTKRLKNLPAATKEEVLEITNHWKPFRTVACMIIWHFYLSRTGVAAAPVF
ncbi:DNA-3-methyladenine glycosylase family protein [Dyadobacter luticola]|uniref:DNA-3-methyladenine glycosylase II n=1 Tax=Dyadobacter luticola TaxID=1979387 RepID=A0A5R9KZH9_9BACT|nr:DNA-3-methyladenine glycosylase [Dyadobacter luticola]TLV01505.1 DNA-3-methyladenine glycosylase 2 family protein [Dyadobacter luticola]